MVPDRRDASLTPALPRVLRLPDLVLGQVLAVVGTNWLGTAARLGTGHRALWLLGLLAFHVPLAVVVVSLTRARPVEGGIYDWVRQALGARLGFLAGWNFWLFVVTFLSTLGLATAQGLDYGAAALGLPAPGLSPSLLHLGLVTLLVVLALSGLSASRWLHDGGAALLAVALLALLATAAGRPVASAPPPLAPLVAFGLFMKMTVYGLAGLECLATLAGEARDPRRDLPRSILIASPLILVFYLGGTEAVLSIVPADRIDLVNPVAQALALGAGPAAAAFAIAALLLRDLAQASLTFTAITRLPLVAGWDRLLPDWFTRLDPRRGMPARSILVAGAATWLLGLLGGLGVGLAEAYQLLQSAAGLFFAANYVLLFAIPLRAPATLPRPALPVRLAAASGLAVTVSFMLLSVVPVVEVNDAAQFASKIAVVFVAGELMGLALLRLGRA